MTVYRLDDPALKIPYNGDDVASPKLQALVENLQPDDLVKVPRSVTQLVLDKPLYWPNQTQTHIRSKSRALRSGHGAPLIRYVGPAVPAVIEMDRTRYCSLKGFDVDIGDAKTAVNLDGYGNGIGTECTIDRVHVTNRKYRDDFTAFTVSLTAQQNQEYHTFRHCHVDGRGTGKAINLGPSYNSKLTRIIGGSYEWLTTAIQMDNGGYKLRDVNFTGNDTNVVCGNAENACEESGAISEHSRCHTRFVNQGTLTVKGGRHSIESTPQGHGYWEFNPNAQATLIGVSYDTQIPDGAVLYQGESYRGLVFLNNYYSGKGMTLAQLGLEVGKGKWFAAEPIGETPYRAYVVISSQDNDGTALMANTLTMGVGNVAELRQKNTRLVPATLAKGAAVRARSAEWRAYRVDGLQPGDMVLDVDTDDANAVSIVRQRVTAWNTLALKLSNPTASNLVPPSGACELLVMRFADPY